MVGERVSSEIQYIARDSKHMVGERVSSHDMQIQYMVGERVSSESQYIARDSKHEFVDIERRY